MQGFSLCLLQLFAVNNLYGRRVSLTVIAVLVAVTTMVSKENSCKFSSAANAVPPPKYAAGQQGCQD